MLAGVMFAWVLRTIKSTKYMEIYNFFYYAAEEILDKAEFKKLKLDQANLFFSVTTNPEFWFRCQLVKDFS